MLSWQRQYTTRIKNKERVRMKIMRKRRKSPRKNGTEPPMQLLVAGKWRHLVVAVQLGQGLVQEEWPSTTRRALWLF